MKSKFYLFTISSAFLLFGCGNEQVSHETEEVSQVLVTTAQEKKADENVSTNKEQVEKELVNHEQSKDKKTESKDSDLSNPKLEEKNTETETVITPEKAEEVVENIVKIAQKNQIVNKITVDESKNEIIANIAFNEETPEQERGTFLFNYILLLEKQYPEQEVKINIEK